MKIQDAISFLEDFEVSQDLTKARDAIKKNLSQLEKDDFENIGTHFYYLLRIILKSHILFETDTAKYFYEKMAKNFAKAEEKYLELLKNSKKKAIVKIQLEVFYQMMERYFSTLESIYRKRDFFEARKKAFTAKMNYRTQSYFFARKIGLFLWYKFLNLTSNYGTSFYRWAATSLIFILGFAAIFHFLQIFTPTLSAVVPYDFVHFSVATFTTLGFGDIFAISTIAKFLSNLEVFVGFVMLGVLIGMLQKKFL